MNCRTCKWYASSYNQNLSELPYGVCSNDKFVQIHTPVFVAPHLQEGEFGYHADQNASYASKTLRVTREFGCVHYVSRDGTSKRFTLIFIFDTSLSHVLLVKKQRGYYIGMLNGVGGKIEDGDPSTESAALRELKEETSIHRSDMSVFNWLTTLHYPSGTELNVFYGVLRKGKDFLQVEDEPLAWYDLDTIANVSDERLAGEGGVAYFIHAAALSCKDQTNTVNAKEGSA